ncbi:MAG: protein kinase family protein [Chloroflexi bacterium]|nr:protein kinase family protein [Chloroflexota bacterium]
MMDKFEFPEGVFISEQFLGRGSYGEVWKVKSRSGVLTRAVKIVAKEDLPILQKEKATLTHLARADRDNMIVRAYSISSIADGRYVLLMDFVGSDPLSDLVDDLNKRDLQAKPWQAQDEYERVRIAAQITRVLNTAYLAQIALTDIKLANFFYDKAQPNLIQVIDWNVVDDENPRQGFYQYTLPRLASILHQVFTGHSLESQPGTIDHSKLGRTIEDEEQSIWDLLTYETRTILYEMAFGHIKGKNPALELWKRWGQQERFWQRLLTAPTETPEEKQKWWFNEWKYVKGLGEEIAPTPQRLNRCEGLLLLDEWPRPEEVKTLGLPVRSEWEDQKVALTLQQVDELLERQEFRPVEIDLLTTRRRPEAALRFQLRSTQLQFYEFAHNHALPIKPLQQFRDVDKAIQQGLYNRAAQLLEEDRLPKVILLSWRNLNSLNTLLDKHLELLSARIRGHAQTLLLEDLLVKYSQQQRSDWKETIDEHLDKLDHAFFEIINAGQKLQEYVDPYYKQHIEWWERDIQQKYKFASLAVRFYHLVKEDRFREAVQNLEELNHSISSVEQEHVWSCLDDMLHNAPALASLKSTGQKVSRTAEEIAEIADSQLLKINATIADNKRLSDEVRDSLWEGARIATELVRKTAINSKGTIENETADEVKTIKITAREGEKKVGDAVDEGMETLNKAIEKSKTVVITATQNGQAMITATANGGVETVNTAITTGAAAVATAAQDGQAKISSAVDGE